MNAIIALQLPDRDGRCEDDPDRNGQCHARQPHRGTRNQPTSIATPKPMTLPNQLAAKTRNDLLDGNCGAKDGFGDTCANQDDKAGQGHGRIPPKNRKQ